MEIIYAIKTIMFNLFFSDGVLYTKKEIKNEIQERFGKERSLERMLNFYKSKSNSSNKLYTLFYVSNALIYNNEHSEKSGYFSTYFSIKQPSKMSPEEKLLKIKDLVDDYIETYRKEILESQNKKYTEEEKLYLDELWGINR
ncbi:MAG TPA: hypothetical protein VNX68_00085 [Nitrosopumilaceae archaeon]|jgi:hypothetical protein|nr:hypothetical protein [Nitrosopumilaceae archaeon]